MGFDGNFFDEDGPAEAARASFGLASLAAITPPPLAMFPPLGLPQPLGFQPGTANILQQSSSVLGGGAVPTAALTVHTLLIRTSGRTKNEDEFGCTF